MDLSKDVDLDDDSCPAGPAKFKGKLIDSSGRHDGNGKSDEQFDSVYSSGYKSFDGLPSGNLDSGICERRLISDEERLIPVDGIASLNLENEDKIVSVDEGFVSSEKLIERVAQTDTIDSRTVEDENKEHQKLIVDIFQQDEDGDTRLQTAIIQENQTLCLYFIWLCNDPKLLNFKNNYLQSALHLAVLTKQAVIARKLMASGALVDSRDHFGNTPLHVASKEGLAYFARILTEPVTYSETKDNRYKLPYQQIPQNLEARNYDGQVCLHLAAENGHIETIDVLLSKGANVNTRDGKSGRSILHYAAESGFMPLLSYLVQQKHCELDINCMTYSGMTPIMLANGRGQHEAVRFLQQAGAFCDTDSSSGEEDMNEESYDDVKINGVIVSQR
ncbi:hypothetical protein ACF0H5_002124 [Mactra antiquata]